MVQMVCIDCALSNCPLWVTTLAWIGGILLYVLIGILVGYIIQAGIYKKARYHDLMHDEESMVLVGGIFWPIAMAVGILWWIIAIISLPFVAATKRDIHRLQRTIENMSVPLAAVHSVAIQNRKFKKGDIVTGIKGNPDNYEHLDEGCVCKIMDINAKGIMSLVLLDHKDKESQKEFIGQTFTAPERNFVLFKEKKKTSSKKKKKK
jgi:hypothetical protein